LFIRFHGREISMSRLAVGTRIAFALLSISFALTAGAEDKKPAADKKPVETEKPVVVEKKPATDKAAAEKSASAKAETPAAKPETAGAKAEKAAKTEPVPAKADKTVKSEAAIPPAAAAAAMEHKPAGPYFQVPRKPAPQRIAMAKTSVKPEPAKEPVHAAPIAPVPAHTLHWSYEGESGPHAWAKLSPEYAKCGAGERQSPIDIREGMKLELEPIAFEYRPSSFKVIDNGHTIQANIGGYNSMRVMGRRFRLVQMHFHRPSEEAIDGRQSEMVAHLVHKDSENRLAVVAVLIDAGGRQPALQSVLNNIPLERGEEIPAAGTLDVTQMLPESKRYFTHMGSLTTPPCTEDVLWIVMKQPVKAAADQLELFARLYPMNARPIQATAGRIIKESN
jgi:carbonic anhydrase